MGYNGGNDEHKAKQEQDYDGGDMDMGGSGWNGNGGNQSYDDDNYGPINVKEDG